MTDVRGHWAATWILEVVRAGLMEPLPNHTFQPDARVRRADFAAIAARGVTALAALQAGGDEAPRPEVSDVAPGSPAYPAVAQVVGAGVMQLANGAFEPQRPLTGSELIAAAARLGALAASRSPHRPPAP